MTTDPTVPDPSVVLELLSAFRKSKVLFAACELGVFDALKQGPTNAVELAGTLNCHPDTLDRLLGAESTATEDANPQGVAH